MALIFFSGSFNAPVSHKYCPMSVLMHVWQYLELSIFNKLPCQIVQSASRLNTIYPLFNSF